MFRRPSKKQLLIQRIIVSSIMTLAVVVIAVGTILFILGYRLDSDRGRIEQGALVQFDSLPNSALVSINGESTNVRTPTKRTIPAGTHTFLMQRDGYHSWSKIVDIKAGTLTWLDYVRLVPTTLTPESVASYPQLSSVISSPDLKWLLAQQKADTAKFELIDLRSAQVATSSVTVPSGVYSGGSNDDVKHTFTPTEWDKGGRYVLVRHTYNKSVEWIVLDTQNVGQSVNVTRLLSVNLTDVTFTGTNGKLLYGLSDGVVRKLDLSSATISRGLVTNVKSFELFDTNIISYEGVDPDRQNLPVVGVYRDGDSAPHVIRRAASKSDTLSIDVGRYFSDLFIAVSENNTVTLLNGDFPASSDTDASSMATFATFETSDVVDDLSFSPSADYVIAQSDKAFVGYELEHKRATTATVEATERSVRPLRWLDDAYLWVVYDGQLTIREFDGTNVHTLSAATSSFDVTLSQNGRYIYSAVKTDTGYSIQRVTMLVD